MNDFIVWLDSKKAHVFALKMTGIEKYIIKKNDKDHHTRHKNDLHKDNHAAQYYDAVAEKLKGAGQLLIIGPGLAKNNFKEHLKSHQTHTLAKKIIGLEKMESFEHKSEKQMMAKAHKFFKTYNLFNNPI